MFTGDGVEGIISLMRKHNQKGFTVVEILLALLVAAAIGFGGYYVWHTQHTAKPATTTASTSAPATTSTPTTTQKYFTISQWGIKAPYNGSLTFQYRIVTQEGATWVYVTSKQLVDAASECTDIVALARYLGSDAYLDGAGRSTGESVLQSVTDGSITEYSKVGSYYYTYSHGHANCARTVSDTARSLQQQTQEELATLSTKFVAE